MGLARESPAFFHSAIDVPNEHFVKVDGTNRPHLLEDDPRAECIPAPDLQDPLLPAQHLGDKLIPGEDEEDTPWIIMPYLVGSQAE
jgi:hypothetical protein